MSAIGDGLEQRVGFRSGLRKVLRKLFPGHWSFLLGEVALFAFVGLVVSGVYLAAFYRPSAATVVYHGSYPSLFGRPLPEAFSDVLALTVDVPFGLVVRQFHHYAAHLFLASLLLHAARVFFTGAFRKPRELTWWIGLGLFAMALLNGFSGYCLPYDIRGGAALRMSLTTLESVPWAGEWLAALVFGASFPGTQILGRLYLLHVFVVPSVILALVGGHLLLVIRQTHTEHGGLWRSDRSEVGAPFWPDQTSRSTSLVFLVLGFVALLSAFAPVEAVEVYGPFQIVSAYKPLEPDWFLMWIEGAWRLLPRQLDFELIGACFTNPFYGAVVLPLIVFGSCAVYPFVDGWVYRRETRTQNLVEPWRERPFRTAVGVAGIAFLVLLSFGALNDVMAAFLRWEVWQANVLWGCVTLGLPAALFLSTLFLLRRLRRRRGTNATPAGDTFRGT